MNLIHDVASARYNSTNAPRLEVPSQAQAEDRRDYLVARGLILTSVSGLLSVVAAICTTMIERGTAWRYSWLTACIVFAVLMTVEIFELCSTIGQHAPQRRTVPNRRS